ncbi:hypothetical protein VTO42DRAFT_7998 [Malbranchea cinnamomea]
MRAASAPAAATTTTTTSTTTSSGSATARPLACDPCRKRKVRCDRRHPCQKCVEACLTCTYHAVPQRKGPKGRTAPVLTALRNESAAAAAAATVAVATTGQTQAQRQASPADLSGMNPNPMMAAAPGPAIGCEAGGTAPVPSMMPQQPPAGHHQSSVNHHHHHPPPHPSSSTTGPEQMPMLWGDMSPPLPPPPVHRRVPSSVLLAHVDVYMKHLFPIMPVFELNSLLLDCANPETLHPSRYAYLVGLCAATHYQLNLACNHELIPSGTPVTRGEDLLAELLCVLREFDPLEDPNTDTLMTSFFLFMVYGNQNKERYAWHYLSQSIAYAVMLGLDQEQTYATMHHAQAELCRRIYWMLFVTERAYGIKNGRPIRLRSNIRKPSVFSSDNPALLYGFTNLISLFEIITPVFYGSNGPCFACGSSGNAPSIQSIYQSLAAVTPLLEEIGEIQQVDIVVTQQWLLARLWRLATEQCLSNLSKSSALLPMQIPATAGKSVMSFLSRVSPKSADAHGIGMELKLYEIGASVSQLARHISPKAAERLSLLTVDLKDLLCGILNSLSKIRGSQSPLFSALLQQSQGVLGLEDVPQSLSPPSSLQIQGHVTDHQEQQQQQQRQPQQQHQRPSNGGDCRCDAGIWPTTLAEQGQIVSADEAYLESDPLGLGADRVEDADGAETRSVVYS